MPARTGGAKQAVRPSNFPFAGWCSPFWVCPSDSGNGALTDNQPTRGLIMRDKAEYYTIDNACDYLHRLYELVPCLESERDRRYARSLLRDLWRIVHFLGHDPNETGLDRLQRERKRWCYWLEREPIRWSVLEDEEAEELEDRVRAAGDVAVEATVAKVVAKLADDVEKIVKALAAEKGGTK
jgi:hypothetical protein